VADPRPRRSWFQLQTAGSKSGEERRGLLPGAGRAARRVRSGAILKVTSAWRRCFVYTPPDYDTSRSARYPVLYLHHGWGRTSTVGWCRAMDPSWTTSLRQECQTHVWSWRTTCRLLSRRGPLRLGPRRPGAAAELRQFRATYTELMFKDLNILRLHEALERPGQARVLRIPARRTNGDVAARFERVRAAAVPIERCRHAEGASGCIVAGGRVCAAP